MKTHTLGFIVDSLTIWIVAFLIVDATSQIYDKPESKFDRNKSENC